MDGTEPPGVSGYSGNHAHTEDTGFMPSVPQIPRPMTIQEMDMKARFDWLFQRCQRSEIRNEELGNQLLEQSKLISQLYGRNLNLPDTTNNNCGESRTTQVAKLNAKNYRTWQKEIEIVLKDMDFWELIHGKKKFQDTQFEKRIHSKRI
jgi:hypothetical protein